MTTLLTIAAILLAVVLYGWYATIVRRRNRVGEALGGIDAQLAQRHDLIPNLLTVAKRFMGHEQGLLEEITRLRAQGAQAIGVAGSDAIAAKFATEQRLGADLQKLFAVAESYPDLKSQAPMMEAQRAMSEVETNIAAARRFYNSAVAELRNAVQIFPGPLLAGVAGVGTLPPFFEATTESRAPVKAADYL